MTNPLSGLRVVEMGSRTSVPYLAKLFVDAGATVIKVESPAGDSFRRWSASGGAVPVDEDSAWFRFLNGGKSSVVLDLESEDGRRRLAELVEQADLVLDDHQPADAERLGVAGPSLREMNPGAVVATITPFGQIGPWADRPANDFTLQALVGATDARGIPGEEPASAGGQLGDFVAASLSAPAILAATLAARASGRGIHIDASQYESMMLAFQVYRPIFDAFAPDYRVTRQVEIPSVEPAADGWVGLCTITGQQWHDFCAMIGAPEMAEDDELSGFEGRMARREEVWAKIHAFTKQHTVDELTELASAFRIPTGPIGTGDKATTFDHFIERGVYVENPHGFTQPRPAYTFSDSALAPLRGAPGLGEGAESFDVEPGPTFGSDPARPLAGIKVLDLSAFWAGPVATNLLRVLGAEVTKVESHIRLDGMRWASGLRRDRVWEWSPVYHGANAGKTVITLDLNTERGREIVEQMIAESDLIVENFSPRVTEGWGFTWERIQQLNPQASFVRVPAFGIDGPWRDRLGFAMTMEQVSGLANRTGHPDGLPIVPRGPVDSIAGMHAMFGAILALVERERVGHGQLVEAPLIEGALQAAAEQVVEYSAYGNVLTRQGNRSPAASPQGLYETKYADRWLAISVETDAQWSSVVDVVGESLVGLDRRRDVDRIDAVLSSWAAEREGIVAAAQLWNSGVPAAHCAHVNDTGRTPQHEFRRFLQWIEHPVTGWVPYFSYPFQVDGVHHDLGGPAPLLGEHTDAVLAALGLGEAEIADLYTANITGDWPAAVPKPV